MDDKLQQQLVFVSHYWKETNTTDRSNEDEQEYRSKQEKEQDQRSHFGSRIRSRKATKLCTGCPPQSLRSRPAPDYVSRGPAGKACRSRSSSRSRSRNRSTERRRIGKGKS